LRTARFCANFATPLRMGLFSGSRKSKLRPEPRQAEAPKLRDAQLAAASYGHPQGGDLYDFVRVAPNRVVFGLLDIAGRLEQNRQIVAATQRVFRCSAVELFAAPDVNEANAMIELCLQLNRTVLATAERICPCPAFAGCYNEELGTICYFNCGHTPGLVRDHTGLTELPATGLPLGLFSHVTCDALMVALEPAAALLLVSRGMLETGNKHEEFGLNGVKATFGQAELGSADNICRTLLAAACRSAVYNDVTALALVRLAIATAIATSG
jgi:serine phosphatase RsbU (regulator of sigma subunit)